jgi:uncharacterized protein YijF (DUF1287 family)
VTYQKKIANQNIAQMIDTFSKSAYQQLTYPTIAIINKGQTSDVYRASNKQHGRMRTRAHARMSASL